MSSVPSRLGGLAVGAGWTFHNVGGAVGLALGLAPYRAFAGSASVIDVSPDAFTSGHRAAMTLIGFVAASAAVSVLALGQPDIRRRRQASGAASTDDRACTR